MKRIHVSGIRIGALIEKHPEFQGLTWQGSDKFPNMSNVSVIENTKNDGGIICDNDSFAGRIKWAYYKGKNPLAGKVIEYIDNSELKFLKEDYPQLLDALNQLDA